MIAKLNGFQNFLIWAVIEIRKRQLLVWLCWNTLLLLLSRFSRVRLCNPRDSSPPGSPVPGILQARTLTWVAISFSNAWKWKVKVKSLSRIQLLATPWTAAYQAPPSMGFPRQEYWSGLGPLKAMKKSHNWIKYASIKHKKLWGIVDLHSTGLGSKTLMIHNFIDYTLWTFSIR